MPVSLSPKSGVVEPHHGHSVFEAMLLLSCHIDDEEGDKGREGQDQVDGDEGELLRGNKESWRE